MECMGVCLFQQKKNNKNRTSILLYHHITESVNLDKSAVGRD